MNAAHFINEKLFVILLMLINELIMKVQLRLVETVVLITSECGCLITVFQMWTNHHRLLISCLSAFKTKQTNKNSVPLRQRAFKVSSQRYINIKLSLLKILKLIIGNVTGISVRMQKDVAHLLWEMKQEFHCWSYYFHFLYEAVKSCPYCFYSVCSSRL